MTSIVPRFSENDKKSIQSLLDFHSEEYPGKDAGMAEKNSVSFRMWKNFDDAVEFGNKLQRLFDAHGCKAQVEKLQPTPGEQIHPPSLECVECRWIKASGNVEDMRRAFDKAGIRYGDFFKPFHSPYNEWPTSITPAQAEYIGLLATARHDTSSGESLAVIEGEPLSMGLLEGILCNTIATQSGLPLNKGNVRYKHMENGVSRLEIKTDVFLSLIKYCGYEDRALSFVDEYNTLDATSDSAKRIGSTGKNPRIADYRDEGRGV